MVGKYVIVRCRRAGVHAGTLKSLDESTKSAVLTNSRRIWEWRSMGGIALSGVAVHGLDTAESRVDSQVSEIWLADPCEIIPCTDAGKKTIVDAPDPQRTVID